MEGMPLKRYGVPIYLATVANSYTHQIILPEAHFHIKSIDASPMKIMHTTTSLFEIFEGKTQCKRTIIFIG